MIDSASLGRKLAPSAAPEQLQHRNIEDLKSRKDPAALQTAARELEALFAYEMIKAMRATTETTKGGIGKDTYMSLFDTELSRIFADRGLGLKEQLMRGITRAAAGGLQSGASAAAPGDKVVAPETKTETPAVQMKREDVKQGRPVHRTTAPADAAGLQPGTEAAEFSPAPADPSGSAMPVEGIVSSRFGMRKHPLSGDRKFHGGMDIAAPEGTAVYPYQSGTVIFSGERPGYGNTVVVDHGNGYTSMYAHNRVNLVKAGDQVGEESLLAEVGSTGLSTGPHLHFEIRREGKKVDPEVMLAQR